MKFTIFVIVAIALVAFSFGYVFAPHEIYGCWHGVVDDGAFVSGNPYMFNESQMEAALRIVAEHAVDEHMYTLAGGYVCADTAVDVWDLLFSQGIKSTIGVGRAEESCKDFKCANHAWVIVRHGNHTWVIETTGGEVLRDDNPGLAPGYLSGMEFDNPREMKEAAGIYK